MACLLYKSREEISSSKYLSHSSSVQECVPILIWKVFIIPFDQELKPVKEETAPTSKSNVPPKGTPLSSSSSAKAGSSTPASGPVSEEEIRAVFEEMTPVTTQDLVNKFKPRLRSPEDKKAFAAILKRISKIQKTTNSNYVILKDR